MLEIGNCYQYGRGVEINREEADKFYNKALDIFKNTYEALDQEASGEQFLLSYLPYRIGKQYYYGQGTEIDFEEARIWFEGASDAGNQYAQYALGNIYYMEMVWKRTLNVQWNTIKRLLCNQILKRNINWQKCMR